jgi:hypothetical protein
MEPARKDFERKTSALLGRRIEQVIYYDFPSELPKPRDWDFGDWHHAVMGVEMETDSGPLSVLWTNTFDSYGVEVFDSAISEHLSIGPGGPEGRSATNHVRWKPHLALPILGVALAWSTRTYTPQKQVWNRELKKYEYFGEPSYTRTLPVAIRLDFEADPVWIVAATVDPGDIETAFVGGDELMVVFSWELMQQIGFTDELFQPL